MSRTSASKPRGRAQQSKPTLTNKAPKLNPRDSWVLDTHELPRQPGSQRLVQRDIVLPEVIGTEVLAVSAGEPIAAELSLESVAEGVLVTGVVTAQAVGACVRCLDDITVPISAQLTDMYVYQERAARAAQTTPGDDLDADELRYLVGDLIDLTEALVDAVGIALPFQPVCAEDCRGLCAECGTKLAGKPEHHHEDLDPRWSALQGLLSGVEREAE